MRHVDRQAFAAMALTLTLTLRLVLTLTAFAARPTASPGSEPAAVKGWSNKGLLLADGRAVELTGIRVLPSASVAISPRRSISDQ